MVIYSTVVDLLIVIHILSIIIAGGNRMRKKVKKVKEVKPGRYVLKGTYQVEWEHAMINIFII
jgi:hypothetical protein